jgi:acyl-CoA synthetase (AMP-forming)/AMP-acid ligase II
MNAASSMVNFPGRGTIAEFVRRQATTRQGGGASIATDDIDAHCRVHLAGYKCLRLITVVDHLPRNDMGKVDKVLLRRTLWSGSDRQIAGQ